MASDFGAGKKELSVSSLEGLSERHFQDNSQVVTYRSPTEVDLQREEGRTWR